MPKPLATPSDETWGERVRRVTRNQGRDAVERIHAECGELLGSRASFVKLTSMTDAPTNRKDRVRAWLLLTACGYEPNAFGIGDDVLPPVFNASRLRSRLAPRLGSGGEPELAGQALSGIAA